MKKKIEPLDQKIQIQELIKEIDENIDGLNIDLSPQEKEMAKEAIIKIQTEHVSPKEALHFTPIMIEQIYDIAYNMFQAGQYKRCLPHFIFLRQLDITNMRYSFAIAACYHYSQNYTEAAANYILCQRIDPLNPIPAFHLYDCFMKLNNPLSALRAIQEALLLAQHDLNKYAELEGKIQLEFNHLKEFLKIYLKDNFGPHAKTQ